MANFRELLGRVKREITESTPEAIHDRLERGERLALLDVREQDEVEHGVVPGARHLGRAHFESRVRTCCPTRTRRSSCTAAPG